LAGLHPPASRRCRRQMKFSHAEYWRGDPHRLAPEEADSRTFALSTSVTTFRALPALKAVWVIRSIPASRRRGCDGPLPRSVFVVSSAAEVDAGRSAADDEDVGTFGGDSGEAAESASSTFRIVQLLNGSIDFTSSRPRHGVQSSCHSRPEHDENQSVPYGLRRSSLPSVLFFSVVPMRVWADAA